MVTRIHMTLSLRDSLTFKTIIGARRIKSICVMVAVAAILQELCRAKHSTEIHQRQNQLSVFLKVIQYNRVNQVTWKTLEW
jgi:hypothetical protein